MFFFFSISLQPSSLRRGLLIRDENHMKTTLSKRVTFDAKLLNKFKATAADDQENTRIGIEAENDGNVIGTKSTEPPKTQGANRAVRIETPAHTQTSAPKPMSASPSHDDCPVCLDKRTDIVLTPCGHMICGSCLDSWRKKQQQTHQQLIAERKIHHNKKFRLTCFACHGLVSREQKLIRMWFWSLFNSFYSFLSKRISIVLINNQFN